MLIVCFLSRSIVLRFNYIAMYISLLFVLCLSYPIVAHYSANVTNDGPVVLGAYITFRAEVLKNDKIDQSTFDFVWVDNMHPQNRANKTHSGVSTWTVRHSPDIYTHGLYTVEVRVLKNFIIDWPLCYARNDFTLEQYLVGKLVLKQNNTAKEKYVSNAVNLQHQIELNNPDMSYLILEAENWTVHWYIDSPAQPVNSTTGKLSWDHTYKEADVSHLITAHIIGYRKTKIATLDSSRSVSNDEILSSTNTTDGIKLDNSMDSANKEKLSYSTFVNASSVDGFVLPSECKDDPKKTICGVFVRHITVKAPVQDVRVLGSNWLQHGNMLNLQLTCNGSAPFNFCVRFFIGDYKVIGNESCKLYSARKAECDFPVTHYFSNSSRYTVLMIVSNDINKNITAMGVTIYEVTKHPQLSIIIVPLTASFLAIILIIFGVAFYFTNRNSYAIEVADFDFTNNNDLEYKTFKERLSEAMHNALNKPEEFSEEDSYNGVPSTSNKKYGSMQ